MVLAWTASLVSKDLEGRPTILQQEILKQDLFVPRFSPETRSLKKTRGRGCRKAKLGGTRKRKRIGKIELDDHT